MYFIYLYGMTESLQLARSLGRVASIQRTLLRLALRDNPGIEPEWYYFLSTIDERGAVRKTDVISINLLLEPTTGIDILNRMIKAGVLDEKEDPADGRARLLRLTKKGLTMLKKAEQQAERVVELFFEQMGESHRGVLGSALAVIERRFAPALAVHRPKTFDELQQSLYLDRDV